MKLNIRTMPAKMLFPIVSIATGVPSFRKYNLTLSHKYHFIWFRVAKNGSRTILNSLYKNRIKLDLGEEFKIRYPVHTYKNYYKFAVARNPWDRLVSCWHGKILRKNAWEYPESLYDKLQDFSEFVDHVADHDLEECDAHMALQTSLIDLNELNYLIRMESFEKDVTRVFRDLGINEFKLEIRNRTKNRKHYTHYYTNESRKKVEKIYEKDIRILGYNY